MTALNTRRVGKRVAVLTRGYRAMDEPLLIKKRVPKADVIVGKNRYVNSRSVNCDVYLLDDGFQHLQIHRDLDIVIDIADARVYREGRSALRDADFVIPRNVRSDAEKLRGKRVVAFAGIANNAQFFDSLRAAGADVIATHEFPDHHRYKPEDIPRGELLVTTEKDAVKLDRDDIITVRLDFILPDEVFAAIDALV